MSIKINIQKKFYIWLKGEIEKKNQFSKRKRKSKEWGVKIDINNIYIYIYILKGKIEKNNNFYKKTKKKIRNQNNENQNGKHNIINLNWMMKLKTNKNFIKGPRQKIRNPNNKDQIGEYNIW